jgi:hypothetical protein
LRAIPIQRIKMLFLAKQKYPLTFSELIFLILVPSCFSPVFAQNGLEERLPQSELDARPPFQWVEGSIGNMRVSRAECRSFPSDQLRQRIVDIALQQWIFFGSPEFLVQWELEEEGLSDGERRSRRPRLSPEESARVATSIAGYWSTTAEGEWIVGRQNDEWIEEGVSARWRDAWSAAFISWVMCESGIDSSEEFQHAIAHHKYIDQAIRARDGVEQKALYIAYDAGEAEVLPGDLLCTGTRPQYQNLAERRAQIGLGARTHCDIVVSVDYDAGTIDTIGGNVQSAVRLKSIQIADDGKLLSPVDPGGRPVFAHLKFQDLMSLASLVDTAAF